MSKRMGEGARARMGLSGLLVALAGVGATPAWAASSVKQIPDEYETTSGTGIGINDGGYAANDAFSAVRANPALMAAQKSYQISGDYNWPTVGRDFYQAGVVDSKTAPIAAGVTYTGFTDNYTYPENGGVPTNASPDDSPLVRRICGALAGTLGKVMIGGGVTWVESNPLLGTSQYQASPTNHVKGLGLNLGLAVGFAPGWSFGAAVENLSNTALDPYMPRTIKAGIAWQALPELTVMIDARQRDRVAAFEGNLPSLDGTTESSSLMQNPERLLIGSAIYQVQDYLRLMASYGRSITDPRQLLAGGLVLSNKQFSLSYTLQRPYMSQSAAHQAVTISAEMSM